MRVIIINTEYLFLIMFCVSYCYCFIVMFYLLLFLGYFSIFVKKVGGFSNLC